MRLVIIGGVAAGLSAASRARRQDASIEILVLEKSERISYAACGLPYFLEGQVRSLDQLRVYTPEFFEKERNIRIRTGAAVAAISHPRREVTLESGERVRYDRLILATGARRPQQDPAAFSIDTWDQTARLSQHLEQAKLRSAAIIGGGYLGLEAAGALRTRGLRVTICEAGSDLLGRQDSWLTAKLVQHLERFRIEVRLDTKQVPAADVTVLAHGLRPNTLLAEGAGIECGRTGAIRVTERMETNLTGVYAAGDCAETTHLVTGRPVWLPLGTTANRTGRVAGACAAGGRNRFPGIVGSSIVRVCGLAVGVTGLSPRQARAENFDPVSVEIEAFEKARYFGGRPCQVQLTADRRSGRLLGAAVLGEDGVSGRIGIAAAALHQRMSAEDFSELDLAYAPPYGTLPDPLMIGARQLLKLLH